MITVSRQHIINTYRRHVNVFVGVVWTVELDGSIDYLSGQPRPPRLLLLLLGAQRVDVL